MIIVYVRRPPRAWHSYPIRIAKSGVNHIAGEPWDSIGGDVSPCPLDRRPVCRHLKTRDNSHGVIVFYLYNLMLDIYLEHHFLCPQPRDAMLMVCQP